jgi:hypothetical protein
VAVAAAIGRLLGYVSGQLLAALLFAIFTAVLLTILGVPAVAPLAMIAGVCDVIPVLGIPLATVPAVVLALAVSPGAAVTVFVALSFAKAPSGGLQEAGWRLGKRRLRFPCGGGTNPEWNRRRCARLPIPASAIGSCLFCSIVHTRFSAPKTDDL